MPCARDEDREVAVLTTLGMLVLGGGAVLLAALFEGSAAAAQTPDVLLLVTATVALTLAREGRRS
jgi:hypothetical protein